MSYNNFTEEKIFKNASVNVLCNKIFEEITTQFPDDVTSDFGVTGTLAKILNGDEIATTTLKVIPFVTNNKTIFNYCANELAKRLSATSILYKESIQLKWKSILFEVWMVNSLTLTTSETIKTQITAEIPANIN